MDKQSKHSKRALPNTPRVSDKIMEYYQKFGQDRDLEKFMRLYSPASSQEDSDKSQRNKCDTNTIDSKRTKSRETISSTSSCEALAMMPSRPLNVCGVVSSKSLPNIDVQGKMNSGDECLSASDVIVDINIETDAPKEKILSISNENLETPKKTYKNITTQTPESIAKSHRRLEWDSLGDVGYKKSMSTSNISTMERSLLKEFFKENSVVSEPGTSGTHHEKQQHQHIIEEHKTVKKLKSTEIEHSTPPLACSTLVEQAITKRGAKPKMITKSTSSTSLHQKFEKFAQTSLIKPPTVHSQEIQCCISSSNSIIEGTATPSSFEYYSSRSSSKSSDLLKEKQQQPQQIKPFEHPFIASITDLLMKRKALGEKNQQKRHQLNNIRELQTKFQAALDENKENQSYSTIDSSTANTFSLSKQAPELDLGIQLICSLIDAKSVNGKQKKQLIRDIVKRITRLEATEESSNSTLGTINSSSSNGHLYHPSHLYDSVRSNVNINQKKENVSKVATDLGVTPIAMEQKSKEEFSEKPNSENDNNNLAPKNKSIEQPIEISETPSHFEVPKDRGHCKQIQSKTKNGYENTLKESNTNMTKALINKETQSDPIMMRGSKEKHLQVSSDRKQMPEARHTIDSKMLEENKINRSTQTSRTATSNSSAASATTTPDLPTQKYIPPAGNELNNSNTDAEQPTMREWLNPLTQSEIEYEEKKRKEMKKKAEAQREKQLKKSKHDCGRVQQLNWIENEIKRLECLKHLLLKDDTNKTDSSLDCSEANSKLVTKDSMETDKLYDTVYSDKSSVLSESAERLVKEIEIILEESHEDIVNVQDNLKRTKDRKKEIQILYEKPTDSENENIKKIKAKFRTLKESINISEEQLLNETDSELSNKPRKQREKIDTPSTEKSQESESLRDMVQQRKREFMEAYKTKKQHHYEALKQQQKENYKYLNIQNQFKDSRTTTTTTATTDSEHYSVPRTLPRKYISSEKSYAYTQHHLALKPQQKEYNWKNGTNKAISQQGNNKPREITKTTTTNTPTTSSSSMFCISSDISTPISSQNLTSTNNTDSNHRYENKTAKTGITVAIQTTDSIIRSKPIYGSKQAPPSSTLIHSTLSNPVCIQVKPKGIAYVIEFNDNKSSSNTDINSNDVSHTKISGDSTSNGVINNTETSLSGKPQLTLQEHLERSKPKFLQQSKERKAILNQLQAMRQERDRQLREIIENTSFNSLDKRLNYLPPPPIQKVRVLNTKAMKALTNKRFSSLPEVVAKQEREMEEKKRRSNRILRDVFNRRLQKRVRSGKLSLNHSKTVI